MSELSKCGKDGCDPVEQYRGQMKPEDHHMQHRRYGAAVNLMEEHGIKLDVQEFYQDVFDVEDLGSEHAYDMRVSCSKCGKSTPWDRVDIERIERRADGDYRRFTVLRDGNKANIIKRWNDGNPVKAP